jgi:hypothetical protein
VFKIAACVFMTGISKVIEAKNPLSIENEFLH